MFLAVRELRFARGRFALMGAVIALISVLIVLLSGLSSGLVNDGVSGLKALPATAFAFDAGTMKDNAFSRSVVDDKQLAAWKKSPGIADAEPMGVNIVNGVTDEGMQIDLTLFGVEPQGFLVPQLSSGRNLGSVDGIVVSESLRDHGVELGTVVTLDRSDVKLTVIGFTQGQATFGHVDVAYLPLDTWRLIAAGLSKPGAPTTGQIDAMHFPFSSVVALRAADGAKPDFAAIDASAGTTTMTLSEAFNASPGYEAETLTLSMIQVFLHAICALVVGAFFMVWTIQRSHDIAVLRAMGSSSRYLVRDSLAQAATLLVGFTVVGVVVGVAMGAMMPAAMPFDLEARPIAVASGLAILLGMIGAAVAVLRITRIDPLPGDGGARRRSSPEGSTRTCVPSSWPPTGRSPTTPTRRPENSTVASRTSTCHPGGRSRSGPRGSRPPAAARRSFGSSGTILSPDRVRTRSGYAGCEVVEVGADLGE